MDNSIYQLYNMVNSLQSDIEAYSDALRRYAVTLPRETLENAVRSGFPEDIYSFYMSQYWEGNENATETVIKYINQSFIPYLKNVSFHLLQAMKEGPGGISASSVLANPSSFSKLQGNSTPQPSDDLTYRTYQLIKKSEAQKKNHKDLEKALGIKQGPPMSISEADKQNANPKYTHKYFRDPEGDVYYFDGKYYKSWLKYPQKMLDNWDKVIRCSENPDYKEAYSINCATCATVYVLRLLGFDVKAKGNPGKEDPNSLNYKISDAKEYPKLWKNFDGTDAEPVHADDWMRANGMTEMTPEDYRKYFEETCKEKGVYVVMLDWNGVDGHATILQRDGNGLHYIEPQVYDSQKGMDGRRKIDDLLYSVSFDGKLIPRLSPNPRHGYGILRVDNKLFNIKYADLFETK